MTDQPQDQQPESPNSVTNVSGGVNANAERIDIGGDAVGRDKIIGKLESMKLLEVKLPDVPDTDEEDEKD
jgi:hypothetical protein